MLSDETNRELVKWGDVTHSRACEKSHMRLWCTLIDHYLYVIVVIVKGFRGLKKKMMC
ncbi:hypothetical protein HanRHA438_Chr05g0234401 [Helianthus annuus]|nr:hypothetical protein HanRHA438_Chr05g0234401 [Helianthus annuus]